MNLFLNPSLNEFRKLINAADPKSLVHNIVVDGDGEVIIDPELKSPGIDVNRYPIKFRMQSPRIYAEMGGQWLQSMYSRLMNEWINKIQKSLVS